MSRHLHVILLPHCVLRQEESWIILLLLGKFLLKPFWHRGPCVSHRRSAIFMGDALPQGGWFVLGVIQRHFNCLTGITSGHNCFLPALLLPSRLLPACSPCKQGSRKRQCFVWGSTHLLCSWTKQL